MSGRRHPAHASSACDWSSRVSCWLFVCTGGRRTELVLCQMTDVVLQTFPTFLLAPTPLAHVAETLVGHLWHLLYMEDEVHVPSATNQVCALSTPSVMPITCHLVFLPEFFQQSEGARSVWYSAYHHILLILPVHQHRPVTLNKASIKFSCMLNKFNKFSQVHTHTFRTLIQLGNNLETSFTSICYLTATFWQIP